MSRFIPSIHPSTIFEGCKSGVPSTTHIEAGTVIVLGKDAELSLGERNTIYPGVLIRTKSGFIRTGDDVSFGPGVKIYETRKGLVIGENTLIAGGVCICGTTHGMEPGTPIRQQPTASKIITIGENVWIGMNSIIHPGITIGDNTIIGSGSVVTRDIESDVIAFGAPCKVVRKR